MDINRKDGRQSPLGFRPPSPLCTLRRSIVKVTSEEYQEMNGQREPSARCPLIPHPVAAFREPTISIKPPFVEWHQTRGINSPFSFQLSCDTSSGYNSGSSSSSIFHSLRRAPSEQSVVYSPGPGHGRDDSASSLIKRALAERPSRVKFLKDSVTRILDQVDARVSFLRETAIELEEEKKKLVGVLSSIETSEDLMLISDVDREEIAVTTERLVRRLNTVSLAVATPRTQEQEKALQTVNMYIENLCKWFASNGETAKQMCRLYLNTCSSGSQCLPTDDNFQRVVIECAADDQKKVRKRLESLMTTFNHAVNPVDNSREAF